MRSLGTVPPVSVAFSPPIFAEFLVRETIQTALMRLGLSHSSLRWSDLHLRAGEELLLPRDSDRGDLGYRRITTASLAEFKDWIGFDDEAIRDGRQVAADVDWSAIVEQPESEQMIAAAARAYLFGDSALVSQYRSVIERHCAPFHAQLLSARRIVLEERASLRFDVLPVVLIADEVIFRGGSLYVSSGCHASFGMVVGKSE